jgi:ribonuclease Y
MTPMECALIACATAVLGLAAGGAGVYTWLRRQDKQNLDSADSRARQLVTQAEKNAENIVKEADLKAKDEFFRRREEFNREVEQFKNQQRDQERVLEKKEDAAEQRQQNLVKKERHLQQTERKVHERRDNLEKKIAEAETLVLQQTAKLHEITGLSREEAERRLLDRVDRELADEVARRIQKSDEELKSVTEEKARRVLAVAIQRYAAEHTADTTVSTVDIPSDDMKGRIIGREGRNIRTFEKATGVDVIVDDTPGVVVVSAFDNVRRETARLALAKLIQDGRIHPTRIEEVVKETQEEMERHILEVGKVATIEANIGTLND